MGEPRAAPMVGGLKVGVGLAWMWSIKFSFYLFIAAVKILSYTWTSE